MESVRYNEYREEYIKKIMEEIKKIPSLNIHRFFETLINLYEENKIFDALFCISMDVYFLLRFLGKHEESEIGEGSCRNTDYSKNSIIHAGNSHSEIYVKFIKKWYDIEPVIRISQSREFQHVSFETPFDFFG